MTPAEGSDLDKVVRPLSRGRKGVLHLFLHRSSALRALTCAYLARTSAEVLSHCHSDEFHSVRPSLCETLFTLIMGEGRD